MSLYFYLLITFTCKALLYCLFSSCIIIFVCFLFLLHCMLTNVSAKLFAEIVWSWMKVSSQNNSYLIHPGTLMYWQSRIHLTRFQGLSRFKFELELLRFPTPYWSYLSQSRMGSPGYISELHSLFPPTARLLEYFSSSQHLVWCFLLSEKILSRNHKLASLGFHPSINPH